MIDTDDLDALAAVLASHYPGQWEACEQTPARPGRYDIGTNVVSTNLGHRRPNTFVVPGSLPKALARYIETVQPRNLRPLLAELRDTRSENDRLREQVQQLRAGRGPAPEAR